MCLSSCIYSISALFQCYNYDNVVRHSPEGLTPLLFLYENMPECLTPWGGDKSHEAIFLYLNDDDLV